MRLQLSSLRQTAKHAAHATLIVEQIYGFVRRANGHFTMVPTSDPTYDAVRLGSINNHGTVVGCETSSTGQQQGLVQLAGGKQVLVNAPVANQQATTPTAINDKNVLTGSWYDPGTGLIHGFAATLVSCH